MNAGTVLIVDDEAPIRSSLRRLLRFDEHEVLAADSGQTALEVLATRRVDVVVSDQQMPGMQGVDLLRAVRELDPPCSRILFSGHVDLELLRQAVNDGEVYRFIGKPWDDDELRLAVRHAIERTRLLRREQDRAERLVHANAELDADVWQREQALDLNHELLDRLPVAVIGIDPDGMITVANVMAHTLFPQMLPGMDVIDVLPTGMVHWLQRELNRERPGRRRYQNDDLHCELVPLGARGWVLSAVPIGRALASPETRRLRRGH
ncbi:MAG: response regulator [Planctomycetota bacterium]